MPEVKDKIEEFSGMDDCVRFVMDKSSLTLPQAERIAAALITRQLDMKLKKAVTQEEIKAFKKEAAKGRLDVSSLSDGEQKDMANIIAAMEGLDNGDIDIRTDEDLVELLSKFAVDPHATDDIITEAFVTGEDDPKIVSSADILTSWTKRSFRGMREGSVSEQEIVKEDSNRVELAKTAVGTTQQMNELGHNKYSVDLAKVDVVEPPYPPELLAAFLEVDETHFRSILPGTLVNVSGSPKSIETVKIGDKVLSHDGAYHKVSKLLPHDVSEDIYAFRIQGVPDIGSTHEHPFLALPSGVRDRRAELCLNRAHAQEQGNSVPPVDDSIYQDLDWINSNDLEKGGYAASPIPILSQKDMQYVVAGNRKLQVNDLFLRAMGLFIAEGCVYVGSKGQYYPGQDRYETSWAFHEKEIEYVREIIQFLDSLGYKGNYVPQNPANL